MSFILNPDVAAVLAAVTESNGAPPTPPVGDVASRRPALDAMLDHFNNQTPDRYLVPLAGWSYDDNATGWDALLGTGHQDKPVDPAAAPARLDDATGLPPAYIEVGQLDIFRDEDLRYALTLSRAGVPVELHLHPGLPHEYDAIVPTVDVAQRAQADRDRVLRSL